MNRSHNYYAGPAAMPTEVMLEAQAELLDYKGTGMSIMETSHRSKEYDAIHCEAIEMLKSLLGLGDDYSVMFLQGGASMQFAMIPMNFLNANNSADYITTGAWSKKALKEAKIIGNAKVAASTEVDGVFTSLPKQTDLTLDPNAAYCHLTSNNTIYGTQFSKFPTTGNVPMVIDMSSDILSKPVDLTNVGVIYAGAQKNLGPAGVTLVIMRKDMLEKCNDGLPTMLSYKTHAEANSLFNTCPTFPIYMVNKVLHWIINNGGLEGMAKRNEAKGKLIYNAIDGSGGYYVNKIAAEDRSLMNVVFNLPTAELEAKFVKEATAARFFGVKGHRSIGGIRASIYNAASVESVTAFTEFMAQFAAKNS
ncbi:MAG: 3-phosphoserine/phosphohydroxythreonine transaminase [Phycisphaerae bacterium]|nr:3-phosphoserine/phosphohydroxythreonine transaminase [Phycisphaerae bacterium]